MLAFGHGLDSPRSMTLEPVRRMVFSRRALLRGMSWAPVALLPSPLRTLRFEPTLESEQVGVSEARLAPHHPAKSPLDDVLKLVVPDSDEFAAEKYAFEIEQILHQWSEGLRSSGSRGASVAEKFLEEAIEGARLRGSKSAVTRSRFGLHVVRRTFPAQVISGREQFAKELAEYFSGFSAVETAEFEIVGIEEVVGSPLTVKVRIRYDIVGTTEGNGREERVGHWLTQWRHGDRN